MGSYKKIISVILVLGMLASTMLTIDASEYEEGVKISTELLEELDVAYEDLLSGNFEDTGEIYSCVIWIEDVDLETAVEAGIEAAEQTNGNYSGETTTTYTYSISGKQRAVLIDVSLDEGATDTYVQTYIETEREKAEELYSEKNSNFVIENFKTRDMSVNYVSKYSPCIFVNLSISKIAELVLKDDVNYIECLSDDEVSADDTGDMTTGEMQTCLELVRINEGKTNFSVSGEGVKIGQMELACPDKTSVRKNPSYNNSAVKGEDDTHADQVYSIMHTIAPNATYYASGLYSNNTSSATEGNYYEQVEWLLSCGVNIINASFGYSNKNDYDLRSRWTDHISYNHDVHFVKSAGNNGMAGINSPGMSYNAITVGNTDWTGGYTIDYQSSYNANGSSKSAQRTYKPDVVAPASCTSYATPIVTGTVALLCDLQPALKTKQPIVKSILAASAGTRTIRYVTTDTNFMRYGAGMVDAAAALYVVNLNHYTTATGRLSTSVSLSASYNMEVTSSESYMRVALAYTNNINLGTANNTHASAVIPDGTIAEVRLLIYDPSGNLVVSSPVTSTTNGANLKVIQFNTNGIAGTYTIKVLLTEPASDDRITNFGVAWW